MLEKAWLTAYEGRCFMEMWKVLKHNDFVAWGPEERERQRAKQELWVGGHLQSVISKGLVN